MWYKPQVVAEKKVPYSAQVPFPYLTALRVPTPNSPARTRDVNKFRRAIIDRPASKKRKGVAFGRVGVPNFDGKNCFGRVEIRPRYRQRYERYYVEIATCYVHLYECRVSDVDAPCKRVSIFTYVTCWHSSRQQSSRRVLHVQVVGTAATLQYTRCFIGRWQSSEQSKEQDAVDKRSIQCCCM